MPPRAKIIVSSQPVLDAVAHYPRHHLGDFIYEPQLKPGRLVPNAPTHRGFSSNPKPLPWDVIRDKENCTLTVKVPHVHLSTVAREEITARSYVWGTDVHTDDSDVVAACIHGGWIRGEWTDYVDPDMLDLDKDADGKRAAKSQNEMTEQAPSYESEGAITTPPPSGPMSIPPGRDLHVTVLILPRLTRYTSCTRFGISSREFGGAHGERHSIHDGLSYMIQSIRWVENGGEPQARLRGKARRERMRKVMMEVSASFGNINGPGQDHDRRTGLRTDFTGSWMRKDRRPVAQVEPPVEEAERAPPEKEGGHGEGDKENRDGATGSVEPVLEPAVEAVMEEPGKTASAAKTVEDAAGGDVEMADV